MRRLTSFCGILFVSSYFLRGAVAALPKSDAIEFLRQEAPGLFADPSPWKDKKVLEEGTRTQLSLLGILPKDPKLADLAVQRCDQFWDEFSRIIVEQKPAADIAFLKSYLSDESGLPNTRSLAGLLLYLETGDITCMAESLKIGPKNINIFTKIRDPRFIDISNSIIGESAREEALARGGVSIDMRHSNIYILRDAYIYVTKAIEFQGSNDGQLKYLFDNFTSIRPINERRQPISAADLALELKGNPKLLHLFLESVVNHGDPKSLIEIEKVLPDATAQIKDSAFDALVALRQREKDLEIVAPSTPPSSIKPN